MSYKESEIIINGNSNNLNILLESEKSNIQQENNKLLVKDLENKIKDLEKNKLIFNDPNMIIKKIEDPNELINRSSSAAPIWYKEFFLLLAFKLINDSTIDNNVLIIVDTNKCNTRKIYFNITNKNNNYFVPSTNFYIYNDYLYCAGTHFSDITVNTVKLNNKWNPKVKELIIEDDIIFKIHINDFLKKKEITNKDITIVWRDENSKYLWKDELIEKGAIAHNYQYESAFTYRVRKVENYLYYEGASAGSSEVLPTARARLNLDNEVVEKIDPLLFAGSTIAFNKELLMFTFFDIVDDKYKKYANKLIKFPDPTKFDNIEIVMDIPLGIFPYTLESINESLIASWFGFGLDPFSSIEGSINKLSIFDIKNKTLLDINNFEWWSKFEAIQKLYYISRNAPRIYDNLNGLDENAILCAMDINKEEQKIRVLLTDGILIETKI